MKRLVWACVITAGISSSAAAMEEGQALAFLQGTWSAASETWIFSDHEWQQFNGGVIVKTTVQIEAHPADMFTVISAQTGKRYLVHANPKFGSMSWFEEGSTQPIGFYQRRSD